MYDVEKTSAELKSIDSNLLISDESLSGISFGSSIINRTMIAKRFHDIFPNAKIIMFIRGQQDSLISNYNNYVENMRGAVALKDFFWFPKKEYLLSDFNNGYNSPSSMETLHINNNRDNFHLDELKYFGLIKLYKNYFSDVHVFLYEDFKKNQQGVLSEIESIVEDNLPDIEKLNVEKKVLRSLDSKGHLVRKIENHWLGLNRSIKVSRYRWWVAKGMGLISRPFLNSNGVKKETEYIVNETREHYLSDNDLIIKNYPEIGIQNYPEKYLSGKHNI